ncbi:MAG: superoxide dismutase [Cyanobacteria bacterium]|nr:superoxide dismutase [Cyanobacteriota bacterium]
MVKPYEAKTYTLQGLDGISQEQLEQHYKLYSGYVNNTNIINEKLSELLRNGQVGTPEYNELKRRFGFEYSGMRLHEFYFGNMRANGGSLSEGSRLYKKLVEDFGSFANWENDFKATGKMRGIGWAVLYQDPFNGRLQNFWVSDHENGHPAGFQPILVMDVWEHAFTVDYKPTEKPNYIDAFFKNIDWDAAESRLK